MIHIDRQRALRAIGLFGLLVAIYFMTYSGTIVSTDEQVLFDGIHSFMENNSYQLTYTHTLRPYRDQPSNNTVIELDLEPMQVYFSAPLFWLADHIPGIGLMQTVWMLNILVTALTAVMLAYFGVALGYRDRTAFAGALMFGLATTAWPYSKLFFREPLFTLLVMISAYCLEKWRQHFDRGHFWIGWLVAALPPLVAAIFTKEASLLILPTLIVVALPGALRRLFNWRLVAGVVLLAVFVVAVLLIYPRFTTGTRYTDLTSRLSSIDLTSLKDSLPAFLLSPGFSVWAFSPVLLIGLGGAIALLRRRQWRQIAVPLVTAVSMIGGYAVFQGVRWYGGTGWGPRYLLPIVPFLILWLLPVIDLMLARRLARWLQAIIVGITAESVLVQIVGATVAVQAFGNYLYFEGLSLSQRTGAVVANMGHVTVSSALNLTTNPTTRTIIPWQDGLWNPLYIPQVVEAHQSGSPSPIAWMVNGSGLIVIPLCVLAIGAALWAITRRGPSRRLLITGGAAVGLALIVMTYGGLRTFYGDVRYTENNPLLWTTLDKLNAEVQSGDAILLNDGAYRNFFMNTYKQPEPIYVLPDARGEHLQLDQPSDLERINPDQVNNAEARAAPYDNLLLNRLADRTRRWWYLTEFGPFSQGRLRPTEQFLERHFFPVQETDLDPNLRLIEYGAIGAPSDLLQSWPQYPANLDFGVARLTGYDLPNGASFKAGDIVPVSLVWRDDGWPQGVEPFDYGINVSLLRADGSTLAQNAAQPLGGFAAMTTWVKGGYYRDNRGLELQSNTPPGDYKLWVSFYDWRNGKNLAVPPNAAGTSDHYIVTTIHVK